MKNPNRKEYKPEINPDQETPDYMGKGTNLEEQEITADHTSDQREIPGDPSSPRNEDGNKDQYTQEDQSYKEERLGEANSTNSSGTPVENP
jgi:hypothetical protein